MLFHYTATFDNDSMRYHGEVDIKYVGIENIEKNRDYIITECKRQFIVDCERWGVDAKKVSSFECYCYCYDIEKLSEYKSVSNEVQLMKWQK